MSKLKLDLSLSNLFTCALYAIIGLMLIVMQGGSLGVVMTVVGVLFIVLGIIDIAKSKDLVKGLIEIVIGVVIITCGWLLVNLILLIFGILLIVKGILDISKTYKKGFMALLPAIITLVLGILLAFTNFAGNLINIICLIVGIIFVINAVLTLFGKKLGK